MAARASFSTLHWQSIKSPWGFGPVNCVCANVFFFFPENTDSCPSCFSSFPHSWGWGKTDKKTETGSRMCKRVRGAKETGVHELYRPPERVGESLAKRWGQKKKEKSRGQQAGSGDWSEDIRMRVGKAGGNRMETVWVWRRVLLANEVWAVSEGMAEDCGRGCWKVGWDWNWRQEQNRKRAKAKAGLCLQEGLRERLLSCPSVWDWSNTPQGCSWSNIGD